MSKQIKHMRLGDILVKTGMITTENIQSALAEQKVTGLRLGEILINKGYISELSLAETLCGQLELPFVSMVNIHPSEQAMSKVPQNIAERLSVMPFEVTEDGKLKVAMSDPLNVYAIDELRVITNMKIDIEVATPSDINKAITGYYKMRSSLNDAIVDIRKQEVELGSGVVTISPTMAQDVTNISTDDAPVIRLVNTILEQAVKENASDVHIEPSEENTRVRMRIDGTLFTSLDIPKNLHPPLIARIKILSGMDIAEKRRSQDGRILIVASGNKIDLRVSTLPSINGEKAVLRLLPQDNEYIGLDRLGFDMYQQKLLKETINVANGIVLVTGPTGSGKSTTLYSLLEIINKPEVNIITIEDPVEYSMTGVTQIQVNEKIGLTFEKALRSILRQDPDKIMVGEIRDTETAHLAVRVALTGHLVLSTLHTNDATSSINRLVDMGVPNFLLASSLRAIAAQRLVRKLCKRCCTEFKVTPDISYQVGIPEGTIVYKAGGCADCRFTGYSGRTVISEVMMIDPVLREMISRGSQTHDLREYARQHGMTTMRESAYKKVIDGVTSIEEMLMATMFD